MSHTPSPFAASLILSLTLFVSVEAAALSIGCSKEGNSKDSSATNVQLGANNSGDSTRFTGDKQVTIESPPSGEGDPSSNSPTVQASDPSMWEEQSHRECSPEKDAYGLDKYKCNLATLNRPSQPDQPTTAGGGAVSPVPGVGDGGELHLDGGAQDGGGLVLGGGVGVDDEGFGDDDFGAWGLAGDA